MSSRGRACSATMSRFCRSIATLLCLTQIALAIPAGAAGAKPATATSPIAADASQPQVPPASGDLTQSSRAPKAIRRPEAIRRPKDVANSGDVSPSSPHIMTCSTLGVDCRTLTVRLSFEGIAPIAGRGIPLHFDLAFNGANRAGFAETGFGWSHNYQMNITQDPSTQNVTVWQEDGNGDVFTANGSQYTAPPTVLSTLSGDSFGNWSLFRKKEQVQYRFNTNAFSLRRLYSITDLNGYTTNLTYNSNGAYTPPTIYQVIDASGRALTLTYASLTFNWNGQAATGMVVTAVADPAGRQIHLAYNDYNGNLTDITDLNGGVTHFAYDGYHNITSVRDPRGNLTYYNYASGAAAGAVSSVVDPLSRTTTFTKSTSTPNPVGTWPYPQPPDSKTTVTDPKGNTTSATYSWNLITSLSKGSSTWKYYNNVYYGNAWGVVDPNGHTTIYKYSTPDINVTDVWQGLADAGPNELAYSCSRSASTRCTHTTYNAFNEPLSVTDGNGFTTTMTYDAYGNALTISRPLNDGSGQVVQTTLHYGDSLHPGDVTSMTDANGKLWKYSYDATGNLATLTDPLGNLTQNAYGGSSRLLSVTDPNGNTTQFGYDNIGNVLSVTDALDHQLVYAYDLNGNVTTQTDPDGNITTYTYDAANQLTVITRADGTTLSKGYHPDGQLYFLQDARGSTVYYYYDNQARLNTSVDPLGRATYYNYDAAGNRSSMYDATNQTTTYSYDALNQLTGVTYSDGKTPNITNIQYDGVGKRTSVYDGYGTASWAYDALDRLRSTRNDAGQTISYSYDLNGALTKITYPNNLVVSRSYDDAGRLNAVNDGARTSSFTYDNASNLTGVNYPNATAMRVAYSKTNKIASITHSRSGSPFATFSYGRDKNEQLTSRSDSGYVPGSENYTYTKLNQLASVNGVAYAYDASDHLTRQLDGTVQAFDVAGELCWAASGYSGTPSCTSKPSNAATYAYDAAGDRTQVAPPGASLQYRGRGTPGVPAPSGTGSHARTVALATVQPIEQLALPAASRRRQSVPNVDIKYSYDMAHRLTQYGNPVKAWYSYDADGMRIGKIVSAGTAGAARAVQSVRGTETKVAFGTRVRSAIAPGTSFYAWSGTGGSARLLEEDTSAGATTYVYGPGGMPLEQIGPSGAVVFYHPDQIGSTRYVTDSGGNVVGEQAYDPFGNLTFSAGTKNVIGFAGEYTDAESGLVYLRARYYEPNSAQFLTVDPLVATTHSPYDYVFNSPLNWTDPSGECFVLCAAVGFAIGAGISIVSQLAHGRSPTTAKFWMKAGIAGVAGALTLLGFGVISDAAGGLAFESADRIALAVSSTGVGGVSNIASQLVNNGGHFSKLSPMETAEAMGLSLVGSVFVQFTVGMFSYFDVSNPVVPGTGRLTAVGIGTIAGAGATKTEILAGRNGGHKHGHRHGKGGGSHGGGAPVASGGTGASAGDPASNCVPYYLARRDYTGCIALP